MRFLVPCFVIALCLTFDLEVNAQQLKLDHVIIAVPDLDSAISYVSRLGFKIKPGTIHANGLKNAHVKFKNGTEFELMTLNSDPKDNIARAYETLIKKGYAGAFLALTGLSIDYIHTTLQASEIDHEIIRGSGWDYLTFPEGSPLSVLFFIEYKKEYPTNERYFAHTNRSHAIDYVTLEANSRIIEVLELLAPTQNTKPNEFYSTNGNVKFIEPRPGKRACIKSIQFKHLPNWDIVTIKL